MHGCTSASAQGGRPPVGFQSIGMGIYFSTSPAGLFSWMIRLIPLSEGELFEARGQSNPLLHSYHCVHFSLPGKCTFRAEHQQLQEEQ